MKRSMSVFGVVIGLTVQGCAPRAVQPLPRAGGGAETSQSEAGEPVRRPRTREEIIEVVENEVRTEHSSYEIGAGESVLNEFESPAKREGHLSKDCPGLSASSARSKKDSCYWRYVEKYLARVHEVYFLADMGQLLKSCQGDIQACWVPGVFERWAVKLHNDDNLRQSGTRVRRVNDWKGPGDPASPDRPIVPPLIRALALPPGSRPAAPILTPFFDGQFVP